MNHVLIVTTVFNALCFVSLHRANGQSGEGHNTRRLKPGENNRDAAGAKVPSTHAERLAHWVKEQEEAGDPNEVIRDIRFYRSACK